MKFGARSARKLALRYLREGDTVVDVGASDGMYSAIYADQIGVRGAVLAIEPHWVSRQVMRLRFHSIPSQSFVLDGVLNDTGTEAVQLFFNANPKHSSLFPENVDGAVTAIQVPSRRLDDVIGLLPRHPRLIQIDAQGAEASILRGAQKVLRKKRSVWIIEVWPEGLRNAGETVAAVTEPFRALSYKPFDMRHHKLTWKVIRQMATEYRAWQHFNLLMVPEAMAA